MRGDVLPSIDSASPVSSGPDTKHGLTPLREGLEVPILRLKHVLDAICAHGHHHLCAALRKRDQRYCERSSCPLTHVVFQHDKTDSSVLAHLVIPAEETEAAGRCLGCVETGGAPSVVVVDLHCLGDTVQQLVVRHSGIESEILAHHLENIVSKTLKN